MNQEKKMTAEIPATSSIHHGASQQKCIHLLVFCMTKVVDTGRYGIKFPALMTAAMISCHVNYPAFDNLKKAYNAKITSIVCCNSYTPERAAILEYPENVTTFIHT